MLMRAIILTGVAALSLAGCAMQPSAPGPMPVAQPDIAAQIAQSEAMIQRAAEDYVRLQLAIGQIEDGYIDAYYGPADWQAAAVAAGKRPIPQLRAEVQALRQLFGGQTGLHPEGSTTRRRLAFFEAQLLAADTRLRMLSGEKLSFRQESLGLFGATPDIRPLSYYDEIRASVDGSVPGKGDLADRVEAFRSKLTIRPERLEPVFRAAIAECRARTLKHIALPDQESFSLEFVTGKSWSGYNWYKGNLASLIQVNTDLPIRISRAVDLGCHEGYPGHHALNMLLEQRLTRELGWVEFSIYPLFSPQSLIAEGSANYGIDMAFPPAERVAFERDVLFPLAGLDPALAQPALHLDAMLSDLGNARFTIAQLYLDGAIDRAEAVRLTRHYLLMDEKRADQSVRFTEHYRSYVINYGLGRDMVRDAVLAAGDDPGAQWTRMEAIISEPTLPVDLVPVDLVVR